MCKSVTNIAITLILIAICSAFGARSAHAACATYASHSGKTDGYYLTNGCTTVIHVYNPCRVVTNNTGHTLFVPSYYPGSSSSTGQSEWTSFLNSKLVAQSGKVSAAACNCNNPWTGVPMSKGATITGYLASSVPCHSSCSSHTRTCTCNTTDGTCYFDQGSYSQQTCSMVACLSCSLPATMGGGSIKDGLSVPAYYRSTVACGSSCAAQTRSCNNGSLSGSYQYQSCSVNPCPCALPASLGGGSISDGNHVKAFRYASVSCGSSCTHQYRICSNGSLSGSYTKSSCSVGSCGCSATSHSWSSGHCSASIPSKNSGQSVTRSNTKPGYSGSIKATCSNGSWSYSSSSCSALTTCPAQTVSWSGTSAFANCSDYVSSATAGTTVNISYDHIGGSREIIGSGTATCTSNGTWSLSAACHALTVGNCGKYKC